MATCRHNFGAVVIKRETGNMNEEIENPVREGEIADRTITPVISANWKLPSWI